MEFCKIGPYIIFSVDGHTRFFQKDFYTVKDAWKLFYRDIRYYKEKHLLHI